MFRVIRIPTEGLGNSSYLFTQDGLGILVDPQRDLDRFERLIEAEEVEPRFVLETHLHNDYLSGGSALSKKTGAELVVPAAAAPVYRHRPAFHLEDIHVGDLVIRPIHTPGHTPEHTSYLILREGVEEAVFTGGSLLVGSAGRTDLMGAERTESLARLQYQSVRRLDRLPRRVELYPTHGAGSFCAAGAPSPDAVSTIGEESKSNPVLAHHSEEAFVKSQLSGLPPYPSYYRYMGRANLAENEEFSPGRLPVLGITELKGIGEEAVLVDARPRLDVAAGHFRGSLAIELGPNFGTWVGCLSPFKAPLVLVANPDQDLDEAQRQLGRIGFDDIRGVVHDPSDCPLASYRTTSVTEFAAAVNAGAQVLDVRWPEEWEQGYLEGSTLRYLPDLVDDRSGIEPGDEVWVACASGYRASIAGSLLVAHGLSPVVLARGGVPDVLSALSGARHGEAVGSFSHVSANSVRTVSRPSGVLRTVFKAPVMLYRVGLGWMLGKRFLALTHRGWKTGQLRETVLEVILCDQDTAESVVVSAYGTKADWYRNLRAQPALRVRTGLTSYVPEQRFLTSEERKEVALEFCRRHPWEAKLVPKVLPAIGAAVPNGLDEHPVDILASLPMVGFRPGA